jgi:hypothetical protein
MNPNSTPLFLADDGVPIPGKIRVWGLERSDGDINNYIELSGKHNQRCEGII